MTNNISQKEIEETVTAHAVRLENKLSLTQARVLIEKGNTDPEYATEDQAAVDQVNAVLKNDTIKKKICAGLQSTSEDLQELSKPLVKVLLPVSAIKGSGAAALGLTWTIATLPVSIIGASILAIYIARFGIGYFCSDHS